MPILLLITLLAKVSFAHDYVYYDYGYPYIGNLVEEFNFDYYSYNMSNFIEFLSDHKNEKKPTDVVETKNEVKNETINDDFIEKKKTSKLEKIKEKNKKPKKTIKKKRKKRKNWNKMTEELLERIKNFHTKNPYLNRTDLSRIFNVATSTLNDWMEKGPAGQRKKK